MIPDYDAAAFVAKYRSICNAATPGPWWRENPDEDRHDGCGSQDYIAHKKTPAYDGDDDWGAIIQCDSGVYGPERNDAEFICAARRAMPEALDLIEQLLAK